ncbi:MAG: hypothetical protein IT379_22980 [Deltaproteobacteria bacterium]|nr:hypothetical protein [Deltaproteobacteria bacterium]
MERERSPSSLAACPSCSRHVRVAESRCPFCACVFDVALAPRPPHAVAGSLTRAAVFFGGATLAASCGPRGGDEARPEAVTTESIAQPYGVPVPPDPPRHPPPPGAAVPPDDEDGGADDSGAPDSGSDADPWGGRTGIDIGAIGQPYGISAMPLPREATQIGRGALPAKRPPRNRPR